MVLDHPGRSAGSNDPGLGVGGDPACQLGDAFEISPEVAMVDRLVVSDTVPKEVNPLDPIVNGLANRSGIAVIWVVQARRPALGPTARSGTTSYTGNARIRSSAQR